MALDSQQVDDMERDASAPSLFYRRLDIFYRSSLFATLAALTGAVILSLLIWRIDGAGPVREWFGATLLVCMLRLLAVAAFFRRDERLRQQEALFWYRLMLIIGTSLGVVWGAAGFLLLVAEDAFSQLLLFLVLSGVASGAAISLAAFYSAGALFLAALVLPFGLRIVLLDSPGAATLAALVFLYLLLMLGLARRANLNLVESLEMAYLRGRAEARIRQQALFDALTGLPNRRLLQDRLEQAVARARRSGHQVVTLFLDLDHFKRINDSLGHAIGDALLVEVASRLRQLLRENDTAARLGGDEFVVLLTDVEGGREEATEIAQRRGRELLRAIEQPMRIEGNLIHISVSIGASLLAHEQPDIGELMSQADTAMYSAKEDGRNTLHFFERSMQDSLNLRAALEKDLRAAIDNEALELHLQPQFHQDTGISGAELLLRWRQGDSLISPASFIAVAEESGLILRLGDWVIEAACRTARRLLLEAPLPADFTLAINVSPRQFRQGDFGDKLLASIRAHDLPPGMIELELTENLLIDDTDDAAAKMHRLRESGVRFSIDDFGTGYSSLRYLKSLPLDALKIDKSFVRDVLTDPGDASIVRAIISLSGTLGIDVIAEGVESEAVRELLLEAGCRRFQGFLFSRALPYATFCEYLQGASARRA